MQLQPLSASGIQVVRVNIENLIKLSAALPGNDGDLSRKRVLGEKDNVARVEPLGFVEVGLAPIPMTPSAFDIGQRLRNSAAVRQK